MGQLLGAILVAAVALAIVILVVLTLKDVIAWFKARTTAYHKDAENVAFTIKEDLKAGKYTIIQGIFNKRTATFVDGRKVECDQVDKDLAAAHTNSKLVVYE